MLVIKKILFILTIVFLMMSHELFSGDFYTLYCTCDDEPLKTYRIFADSKDLAIKKANHSFKNFLTDNLGYQKKDMAEKQCGCGLIQKKRFFDLED